MNRLVLAGVFALVPGLMRAAALTNGDFETGDLTGWTLGSSTAFDKVCLTGSVVGAATCSVHGGSYAMTFGHAFGFTTLSQTIATTPGQLYDVSFYLAIDGPYNYTGVNEIFEMSWDGTTVFSLSNPTAAFPYGLRSTTSLLATSSATVLEFRARHDPSQWFLDNVAVGDAVPEPGSVTLGVIGAILLVRRRGGGRRPLTPRAAGK